MMVAIGSALFLAMLGHFLWMGRDDPRFKPRRRCTHFDGNDDADRLDIRQRDDHEEAWCRACGKMLSILWWETDECESRLIIGPRAVALSTGARRAKVLAAEATRRAGQKRRRAQAIDMHRKH